MLPVVTVVLWLSTRTVSQILFHCEVCIIPFVSQIQEKLFPSTGRIQCKKTKLMCLGAFTLRSARVEFLGLIVMAWNLLKRQVLKNKQTKKKRSC